MNYISSLFFGSSEEASGDAGAGEKSKLTAEQEEFVHNLQ